MSRSSNEYMKTYMLRRYKKRVEEARIRLGNKCAKCGNTENLEFDHINPKEKSFNISKVWSFNKKLFDAEIDKCQLLCNECHKEKTLVDKGQKSARLFHGTLSSYRYCRCELCRQANKDYCKLKRLQKKNAFVA